MAAKKVAKSVDRSAVKPELGNIGVDINYRSLMRYMNRDLSFPYCMKTYDEMARSSVIASTLAAVNTIASQVDFYIESYDETDTHRNRAQFLEEALFKDMEYPFNQVVRDALTDVKYGFSVLEKVYRFRRKEDGSKFNDGRIGIKYLPLRDQRSIAQFKYDDSNRYLTKVIQDRVGVKNAQSSQVEIDPNRVLIFRVNPTTNAPYGNAPLADAYRSWKILEKLKDIETTSTNRNLNGIPLLKVPSELMDADSDDPEEKAKIASMRGNMSRVSTGEQSYVILPSDKYTQDDGGGNQYDFTVVTGSSSHLTALNQTINRYNSEVFQAMCADILIMDNGQGGGSTSLTANKQTMLYMFVQARLLEFIDVINNDLIPDLWRANLWDMTKCPKLKFKRVEKISVAELAKAIQQLAATNTFPITVENTNYISELFGFPTRLDPTTTRDELVDILGFNLDMQSRAGDGSKRGTVGNGTAKSVSGQDNNANNLNKK